MRWPSATTAAMAAENVENFTFTNPAQSAKPLDRKKAEMEQNLVVLGVQITSANSELERLRAEQDNLTPMAAIRAHICGQCHKSGHTKTTCKSRPCSSSSICKIRDKHPEMKNNIASLQAELKALQKQEEKQRNELDSFSAAREKSTSSFF